MFGLEGFSGSCAPICDSARITPEVQTACDSGSQQYCSDASKINSLECKTYLRRFTGPTERDGVVYNRPVKPVVGSSVQSYLSGLASAAASFAGVGNNIAGTDFAEIQKIFADAGQSIITEDILNSAIRYAAANPSDAKFCSLANEPKSWFATQVPTRVVNKFYTLTKTYIDSDRDVLNVYSVDPSMRTIHGMYPDVFVPIEDIILKAIKPEHFSDPRLIQLRSITPRMKEKLDLMVIEIAKNRASSAAAIRAEENRLDELEMQKKIAALMAEQAAAEQAASEQNIQAATATKVAEIDAAAASALAATVSSEQPQAMASKEMFDPNNDVEITNRIKEVNDLIKKIDTVLDQARKAVSTMPEGMTKKNYTSQLSNFRNSINIKKNRLKDLIKKLSPNASKGDRVSIAYMIDSIGNSVNDIYLRSIKNAPIFKDLKIETYKPKPLNTKLDRMSLGHINERFMSKKERLNVSAGDLINNSLLYDDVFKTYLNNINKVDSKDSLNVLLSNAEDELLKNCATGDKSITDSTCLDMMNKSSQYKDRLSKLQKDYCMANPLNMKCVALFNRNPDRFDMNQVYSMVLKKCVVEGAKEAACANETMYVGLSEYLKTNTMNTTSMDSSNKITDVMPICKGAGQFSATNCAAICKKYPNVCITDTINKCSLPKYRYDKASTDRFSNVKESLSESINLDIDDTARIVRIIYIVLFFIIVIVFALAMMGRYENSERKLAHCYSIQSIINSHDET